MSGLRPLFQWAGFARMAGYARIISSRLAGYARIIFPRLAGYARMFSRCNFILSPIH